MTVVPTQRGPLDFTARPAVWTPAGTTGEVVLPRDLKPGDQVLIYKAHGYWGLADARPVHTPRYAEWGLFTGRNRRNLSVITPSGSVPVTLGVRTLDREVIRRTDRPVSVHDFEPGHSGMSCVRMVERPDGTGDACGEPVKSAIHDPAAYSAFATELKAELARFSASSLEPATVAAFDAARRANAEILGPIDKTAVTAKRIDSILNSGATDAMDQALETAFPSQDEGAEVMARNGARVHWRKTSWSGLTVCGLDVDSLANGYDGPKCQECFPTTQRTELETMRDKVAGHLEAAKTVLEVAYARGGTSAECSALAVVRALEALVKDLGL